MTQTSVAEPTTAKAKQAPRARPIQAGDVLGGVEVLWIVDPEETLLERRFYWVRFACCGRCGEVSHRGLRQRANLNEKACGECRRRVRAEEGASAETLERRAKAKAKALAMSGAWR